MGAGVSVPWFEPPNSTASPQCDSGQGASPLCAAREQRKLSAGQTVKAQ